MTDVRPEDIKCSLETCGEQVLGRGVLVIPVLPHADEIEYDYNNLAIFHPNCYVEVFNAIFQQESITTHYQVYIGSVFDLWAGLYTDDDDEAGVPGGND